MKSSEIVTSDSTPVLNGRSYRLQKEKTKIEGVHSPFLALAILNEARGLCTESVHE